VLLNTNVHSNTLALMCAATVFIVPRSRNMYNTILFLFNTSTIEWSSIGLVCVCMCDFAHYHCSCCTELKIDITVFQEMGP